MTIAVRFTNKDGRLLGRWDTPAIEGLPIEGEFISPNPPVPPAIPGEGPPNINDPATLAKLFPKPSQRIVVSLLSLEFKVEEQDWSNNVVSFDLMRPMHGETQGVVELRSGRSVRLLDPAATGKFKAGSKVSLTVNLPNQSVPLLLGGYIVEPPKFRVEEPNIGALSLRIGDLFLLKRQSETGLIEPYCGPLPRTTAEAASIFARVRGLPGVFGGEALVENINPDFIEGAPWDFLSSLYEVLDYDVRSDINGNPLAVPRTKFNPQTALILEEYQVLEASWDAPQSLPFSKVPGYNTFDRSLGFRVNETTREDFSKFNPSNTEPWFTSNNTYEVVKTTLLGDTAVQVVTQTWGYLPNNTLVPPSGLPTPDTGPCGEFIPPPEVIVTTRLDIIQTKTYRAYFEGHASGAYIITATEETVEGWNTYQDEDTNTILYFGQLEASKSTYKHQAVINEGVCPQYWEVVRTGEEKFTYARVSVAEFQEPVFQLTSKQSVTWAESEEVVGEGQVRTWKSSKSSQSYDAKTARWSGGELPVEETLNPPQAQFIREFKVPVSLEIETLYPEFQELFGDRPSKPVQFPQAYTNRELLTATERYARESTGLAYSIHLIVDPRVPIRPGAPIIYKRPGTQEVHGIAWSVEFNCTGSQISQSVILMRTFTEPALLAIRNNPNFIPPTSQSLSSECFPDA